MSTQSVHIVIDKEEEKGENEMDILIKREFYMGEKDEQRRKKEIEKKTAF